MIAVALLPEDDGYTYRLETKPMKSNSPGGWETVPGYEAKTKQQCDKEKERLLALAKENRLGKTYRVRQNRDDGGTFPDSLEFGCWSK